MDTLTVTHIKPFRGFLEIYGHKKTELLTQLEAEIAAYQPHTKKIALQPDDLHPNLEFDTIYLALSVGTNKYHRCVVLEKRANNRATIELIDYGNNFEVDTSFVSKTFNLFMFKYKYTSKIKFLFCFRHSFVKSNLLFFVVDWSRLFLNSFKSY